MCTHAFLDTCRVRSVIHAAVASLDADVWMAMPRVEVSKWFWPSFTRVDIASLSFGVYIYKITNSSRVEGDLLGLLPSQEDRAFAEPFRQGRRRFHESAQDCAKVS